MLTSVITSQCTSCRGPIYSTRFCESCGWQVAATTSAQEEGLRSTGAKKRRGLFGRDHRGNAASSGVVARTNPRRRVLLVSGIVVAVVLAGAGAVAAVATIGGFASAPGSQPPAGDAAQAPPIVETANATEPAVEQSAEPQPQLPARPPMPTGCESLYTSAMVAELESYGVVLNPAWAVAELSDSVPFEDPQLVASVNALPNLQCLWVSPLGGSGVGLETRVTPVTPDEASAIQTRLASLGYDPIDELGGTRYVFEVDGSEGGAAYGESHIVVGGYWFGTAWLELGVYGYTADMVTTLL